MSDPIVVPPSGRGRLREFLRLRNRRSHYMIGALSGLLGFAAVVQVHQTSEANLSGLSEDELVRVLDSVTERGDALEQELSDLERERAALQNGSDTQQAALQAAERNAEVQGILSGRLPAVGPGVRIIIADVDAEVRPVTLLTTLEELRNAGAEVVELNGVRIVASSSFTGSAGRVAVDGNLIAAPYTWTVIGDPGTLSTALEIPGGAQSAVRRDGGRLTVTEADEVEILATVEPSEPQFATPTAADGN